MFVATWHYLSPIHISAIKQSSLLLANTLSVKQGDGGWHQRPPLHIGSYLFPELWLASSFHYRQSLLRCPTFPQYRHMGRPVSQLCVVGKSFLMGLQSLPPVATLVILLLPSQSSFRAWLRASMRDLSGSLARTRLANCSMAAAISYCDSPLS